jgi:hypothetical protein
VQDAGKLLWITTEDPVQQALHATCAAAAARWGLAAMLNVVGELRLATVAGVLQPKGATAGESIAGASMPRKMSTCQHGRCNLPPSYSISSLIPYNPPYNNKTEEDIKTEENCLLMPRKLSTCQH